MLRAVVDVAGGLNRRPSAYCKPASKHTQRYYNTVCKQYAQAYTVTNFTQKNVTK
jgi:hypothetical protein